MALLAMFSFDDEMSLARITDKSVNATIQTGGRTGKMLRLQGGTANDAADCYAHILFPSSTATLTTGFAYKPPSGADSSGDGRFVAFRAVAAAIDHVVCYYDRLTGAVTAKVGATTIGSATAGTLTLDQWHYVEARILVADSSGTFDLWVNGTNVITFTGDTRNGGATAAVDAVRLMGRRLNVSCGFDDLYILDNSGSVNNARLGEIAIECLRPNGNGNSSQWVGSDGNSTDNYLLVDDTTPDTADYVQSGTSGNKDTYAYGNLAAASGTIAAVQVVSYASKTAGDALSVQQVARSGSSETAATAQAVTATWAPLTAIFEAKPGGGAWTVSDVNGAEFGVQVA